MNIADEINQVIRRMTSSGESHRIILERTFDTDAMDLGEACTTAERISRRFEPVRGDLTLGSRYLLTGVGVQGDILRCVPACHFAIACGYQGDISYVDLVPHDDDRTVNRGHDGLFR